MGEDRQRAALSGADAEDRALALLRSAGLQLVARNWRCPGGELDLVMRDGASWVFVEVRLRASRRFGGALESIDARKRTRLVKAATRYLQQYRIDAPCRFDAVVFEGADAPPLWIKDIIA